MFAKWSLQKKMIVAFSTCALMLLVVGGIGFNALRTVAKYGGKIGNVNLADAVEVSNMRGQARRITVDLAEMGLDFQTPEGVAKLQTDLSAAIDAYEQADKVYFAIPFLPGEEALYNEQNEVWKKLEPVAKKIGALASQTGPAAKTEFFRAYREEYEPLTAEHLSKITRIMDFHHKDTQATVEAAEAATRYGNIFSLATMGVGFVLSLMTGFLFSRSLSKTLGDLASRLESGADQVASASQQISSAGASLSSSATEQAAALQETVASVDEISAMISKNAENAKKSQEFATQSHGAATKGKQTVEDMIHSINEIDKSNHDIMSQIEQSNREISDIVKVISEIGNKTKVINDIVFQTKLLSFNASVEAARAGEHGKGFAVVAEEVGNLAQMSGNAAKEISQMLDDSIHKVEGIVNDTKTRVEKLVVSGTQKVEAGQVTAKQCGVVLDEIVRNVVEVNQMVNEIATASQEQSQGVQEITKAMSQLDQVTQQNAAASEQSASASEQLSRQASELNTIVTTLVSTIEGGGNQSAQHSEKRGNVIQFQPVAAPKAKASAPSHASFKKAKKAVGAEGIPSENDPRFEDI